MVNTTACSLSTISVNYWMIRLKKSSINFKLPRERFVNELVIYFEDPDGLGLELVFTDFDKRPGNSYLHIPPEHTIRGLYNVEIWVEGYERTAGLLTEDLDHVLIAEKGSRFRFAATEAPGNFIDIICAPDSLWGFGGSGTVHHIA